MLTEAQTEEAASRLHDAERRGVQIRQFSLEFPGLTIADAYGIQRAWARLKLSEGRVVRGHKIGLTSKAMQAAVNIDEPDYGVLFDDMFFDEGGEVPTARFIQLRVEAELAFILKEPLTGPGCTVEQVLAATDYIVPALEILDARIQRVDPGSGATRKVVDTISDNAANAGIVLGRGRIRPGETDLRWIGAICRRNGEIEETGLAAGVLGDPVKGVAWLADRLAAFGVGLEPGQVVLSGSFIRPVDVAAGDVIEADFGPHGRIVSRFV